MNTLDIILGIILVIAFFRGFRKGLLRSLAALVGFVAAAYCAMFLSEYVEVYLVKWFNWSEYVNQVVAFLFMFIAIMFLFALLGRVLTKAADFMMMGLFNKLLGGLFNALKAAFLLSVIFMFVNASEEYRILSQKKRDASLLYNPIEALAPATLPAIESQVSDLDIDFDFNKSDETDEVLLEQKSDSISSTLP